MRVYNIKPKDKMRIINDLQIYYPYLDMEFHMESEQSLLHTHIHTQPI